MSSNKKIELSDDDWKKVNNACAIQCTGEEIAHIMGFSYDTLERRIKETFNEPAADYIKRHAQGGKATLRRLQWKAANNGNTSMLIWLGKQYLGQTDRNEAINKDSAELLADAMNNLADRLPS